MAKYQLAGSILFNLFVVDKIENDDADKIPNSGS